MNDDNLNIMKLLVEKGQDYGKSSLNLIKLKAIDKGAEITSTVITKALLIHVFIVFITLVSVSVALMLGDMLGKVYYGFFIIAAFHFLLWIVLYMFYSTVKSKINNGVISNILKQ